MPRVRQLSQHYANEDFVKELRKKMIDYNYRSVKEIALIIQMAPRTLYRKVQSPDSFCVSDFRKIIPILQPDPGITLTLLGYSKQDIKQFKER